MKAKHRLSAKSNQYYRDIAAEIGMSTEDVKIIVLAGVGLLDLYDTIIAMMTEYHRSLGRSV